MKRNAFKITLSSQWTIRLYRILQLNFVTPSASQATHKFPPRQNLSLVSGKGKSQGFCAGLFAPSLFAFFFSLSCASFPNEERMEMRRTCWTSYFGHRAGKTPSWHVDTPTHHTSCQKRRVTEEKICMGTTAIAIVTHWLF